eukprot:355813-Chlamydomonas_euryale.AAC.2
MSGRGRPWCMTCCPCFCSRQLTHPTHEPAPQLRPRGARHPRVDVRGDGVRPAADQRRQHLHLRVGVEQQPCGIQGDDDRRAGLGVGGAAPHVCCGCVPPHRRALPGVPDQVGGGAGGGGGRKA